MKKSILFATLCAAFLLAACDKNEPKDGSNNNDPKNDTKEAVDLGLSVKWATCNVGATSPEKYGNYYAWGETTTKDHYSWDTYKYGSNYDALTKYCSDSSYGTDGFTDKLTTLEASDDAATANWGSAWRMPTDNEWLELRNSCTWTWTTKNGVNGYEVKAKNGNSIFLPAAGYYYYIGLSREGGYGYYWSSSLDADRPYYAWEADLGSYTVGRYGRNRYCGCSVRPVCE